MTKTDYSQRCEYPRSAASTKCHHRANPRDMPKQLGPPLSACFRDDTTRPSPGERQQSFVIRPRDDDRTGVLRHRQGTWSFLSASEMTIAPTRTVNIHQRVDNGRRPPGPRDPSPPPRAPRQNTSLSPLRHSTGTCPHERNGGRHQYCTRYPMPPWRSLTHKTPVYCQCVFYYSLFFFTVKADT